MRYRITHFVAVASLIAFLVFCLHRANAQFGQTGQVDTVSSATPTPTPTPTGGPGPNETPGVNLITMVSGANTNASFRLQHGTYRMATADGGSYLALNPKAGQQFIGCDLSDNCSPAAVPTAAPQAADITGAIRLTTDNSGIDSTWHHISSGTTVGGIVLPNDVWYNEVGSGNFLSAINNGSANVDCLLAGTQDGVTAPNASVLLWQASYHYPTASSCGATSSSPACFINSNGDLMRVSSGTGNSGSSPPTWPTTVGGTVSDGTLTETLMGKANTTAGPGACIFSQDVFYNSVPKAHTIVWPPTPGYWYMDAAENRGTHGAYTVYVADDPTSTTVELSVLPYAFVGSAAGVVVKGLTIEKFASYFQQAALSACAQSWAVEYNYFAHNHAFGARFLPSNSQVGCAAGLNNEALNSVMSYNEFMENGQAGFGSGLDVGSTFSYNRLDRNGFASYAYGGEGGNKFAGLHEIITHNTCNYENGNCYWTDDGGAISQNSAYDETVSNNTASYAAGQGIRIEISANAVVEDNTLLDNVQPSAGLCVAPHVPLVNGIDCCTGAQTQNGSCTSPVCFTASSAIPESLSMNKSQGWTVGASGHGNTVTANCDGGIQASVSTATSVTATPESAAYNTINYTGSASAVPGTKAIGFVGGTYPTNTFQHNTYHMGSAASGNNFDNNGTLEPWATWQTIQDSLGSCCS